MDRLAELIGPVVFELSISDLVGGYLSDFEYFRVQLDLTSSERMRYELEISVYRKVFIEFRAAFPNGSYPDWIRFACRTEEGRSALSAFQKARKLLGHCEAKTGALDGLLRRHWNQKTLIFTSDTDSAYAVARRHLIMPITAEIGRKEREAMIQRFKSGEIRALVSCRVLNEGIDVPDAEVAVILVDTKARVNTSSASAESYVPRPARKH